MRTWITSRSRETAACGRSTRRTTRERCSGSKKGGWFSTDERLYVGQRDYSKLVAGMAKQVEAIKGAIGEPVMQEFDVTVRAALCFVDAEWSLFAKPFTLDGVWIGWAKALGTRLQTAGILTPEHMRMLARRVAEALPPA